MSQDKSAKLCARYGARFGCGAPGDCWCAAEPYRLPLTDAGRTEDCLCPACLRAQAETQRRARA